MDKRKVINAYQRGLLTVQECAQVLGVERVQLIRYLDHELHEGSLQHPPSSSSNALDHL
ncbi:hypothetical protein [Paenibacillus sp. CAA11]|uniref:hypothetical protein n=1 Tax=Paenibacillus sp. CAA11 TaxID=1532905 RepID=UPI00131F13C1|nr:hypothetical protein [Paenibacillus sp. CAA11]